ncbi:hypothetical protein QTN47_17170 [Danxiaibacter flavus]|uniref:DUF4252 domain-containing protein n=1 Tax=Danxiaibacter flavus TaxID=3049108 RepID=A0ABV3ZH61_9BACT|nr:hypothetical protein QNM32_17180 [Chitinophagaceae bacterium DXS]
MKRILALILLLSACSPKAVPLKNTYDTKPFEVVSKSDFETVWGRVIEMFAKQGIGIKIIDKSSGLIVAENTAAPVTTEDKNGNLLNPKAWAVIQKIYDPASGKYLYAKEGNIEWNIFVKRNQDSTTTVNINLINVSNISSFYAVGNTSVNLSKTNRSRAISTKVFEKQVAEQVI